jgi:glyceraldehyde-3-phosphate dehydrogenase (NADP+)
MTTQLTGQKMFLAGDWVKSDRVIEVRDPQDNSIIDTVPAASAEDMMNCIEEAKDGAKIASSMPVHQRMKIVNAAADYIEQNSEKYARTIAREGSKTIRQATKEVARCIQIGDALVTHPAIRMISFTGGLEAGEEISRKAGLKKISMELGSNSPVIVLEDADLEDAVESTVSGAFWAAGQNCLGVQRIYIQESIINEFEKSFVERTNQYCVGDKQSELTDMGPLINEKEAIRVENLVNEAIDKGALLLTGGERNGAFYSPTVLANVPEDCTISKEEIFGPVVLLYSVSDLDDAIQQSNDVNYGLQAGIFTKDIDNAHKAIAKMDVGGIMINDSGDYRIDAMPFGGTKKSGLGREGIKFSIHEMTDPKVVCFKLSNF